MASNRALTWNTLALACKTRFVGLAILCLVPTLTGNTRIHLFEHDRCVQDAACRGHAARQYSRLQLVWRRTHQRLPCMRVSIHLRMNSARHSSSAARQILPTAMLKVNGYLHSTSGCREEGSACEGHHTWAHNACKAEDPVPSRTSSDA